MPSEVAHDPTGELDPIVSSRLVRASPTEVFAALTEDLGAWWDPRLTPDAATYRGAEVERGVGGAVRFLHAGDRAFEFARVTEWRPGALLALSFWLALDPDHPTTVTVDLAAQEGGTLVTLAHGGWTPANGGSRRKFNEWPQLLQRFATLVEG